MAVLVPTGFRPHTGKAALTPAVAFWYDLVDGRVIRGGIGDMFPLGGGGFDALISQLAIGRTFADHDVPLFGDFILYASTVMDRPRARSRPSLRRSP